MYNDQQLLYFNLNQIDQHLPDPVIPLRHTSPSLQMLQPKPKFHIRIKSNLNNLDILINQIQLYMPNFPHITHQNWNVINSKDIMYLHIPKLLSLLQDPIKQISCFYFQVIIPQLLYFLFILLQITLVYYVLKLNIQFQLQLTLQNELFYSHSLEYRSLRLDYIHQFKHKQKEFNLFTNFTFYNRSL